ncbi:DMT family transporter [Anaerofustis stercorihominis]|uniref:DMT family transporter n=1 Tax=Anaerofustis stercorihominis TaxID=214853 RepID=UPI00214C10C3|nr:DMT family transporter [Anaerofustis stercorihominis]MCR2033825.1 DMT family transporter [Anaerofustis stercorihominis]
MSDNKKIMPYITGFIYSFIFGISFAFTSEVLTVLHPLQLPAVRFLFAALFITVLYFFGAFKLSYKGKDMKPLILLAMFEPLLYFIFETYGVKLTTSSLSGTMIATIPVVVCILAVIFLRERPSFLQWVFIVLSVIGSVIVVTGSGSSGSNTSEMIGILCLLGAVVSGAGYNIMNKIVCEKFTAIEVTFFMMWFAAITFGIISIFYSKGFGGYIAAFTNVKVLLILLYLGTVSSVLAFFCYNFTLHNLPIAPAAAFANLITVISVIAGVFVRKEPFTLIQMLGAAIIVAGVFGVNLLGNDENDGLSEFEIES